MIFTEAQVRELLAIIDYHHAFSIGVNLGFDVLESEDLSILKVFGINIEDYVGDMPVYDQIYHFGRLSAILSINQTDTLNFDDFSKFIKRGQYIPLTKREQIELELSKRQTYSHLKGLKQKVKETTEGIILEEEKISRELYEKTIKDETTRGTQERRSISSIVSEIGHKLDTWTHDWGRIVETESQGLYNGSRAEIFRQKEGDDVRVWKQVYEGACRHCIRLHLTAGLGSKPVILPLSTIVANGNNIGVKVAEWKFVVGATHPHCRCDLRYVPARYIWDQATQSFRLPKVLEDRVERKSKVKMTVGDKYFEV